MNLIIDPVSRKPVEKTLYGRIMSNVPVNERAETVFLRPHDTARWARVKLGGSLYDELFKFAFVRNPFDLLVSRYEFIRQKHWHHRHEEMRDKSFSDFLAMEEKRHRYQNRDQLSFVADKHGALIVDEIYRFENLRADIERMAAQIGADVPAQLPWRHRIDKDHYSTYYDAETRARAEKLFSRDLDAFGYTFEQG